jgi:hypothetical protein
MFSNLSSLSLPDGSFFNLHGYDVRENGPKRVDPFERLMTIPIPYWDGAETCDAIESFVGTDRAEVTIAITNKSLYRVEHASNQVTPVWWQKEYTLTSYVSATGVVTVTTDNPVTQKIEIGDLIVFAHLGLTQAYPITNRNATTITTTSGLGTITGSTKFYIVKRMNPGDSYVVDYTMFTRTDKAAMVLVDGADNGIYYYDGTYMTPFVLHDQADAATYISARTVTYFEGRLYFGCVGDGTYTYVNRLIWSEVLDLTEINDISYQDLTATRGQALKLVSLGSLIFCYFTDSIYFGRKTNLVGIPYAFTKLDTGGITTVGMRAVTPFMDGQVFVGQDDIYYVTPQGGLEPIGSPVMRNTVLPSTNSGTLHRTHVRVDVPRNRIVFGFTAGPTQYFSIAALFNYRTKAWSTMTLGNISTFNLVNFLDNVEYDDYPIDTDNEYQDFPALRYADITPSALDRQFASVDAIGNLYILKPGATQNLLPSNAAQPVPTVIETGDFDFNAPDMDKSALRLGIKLNTLSEYGRTGTVVFLAQASNDRGLTWKTIGTLSVPTNKSEDTISFRITGSTLRFRLTSASVVEPYEINEYTLRINGRGIEANRANTNSNP